MCSNMPVMCLFYNLYKCALNPYMSNLIFSGMGMGTGGILTSILKNRLSGKLSVGQPSFSVVSGILSVGDPNISVVSGILSVVGIPPVPIPIPEKIQLLMYVI